jgi:hypothetical protein
MHATCVVNFILPCLIDLIISGKSKYYKISRYQYKVLYLLFQITELTNLQSNEVTNSTELRCSWETASRSDNQEFPNALWNPN